MTQVYETLIQDLKKICESLKKKADVSLKELGVTHGQAQLIIELSSHEGNTMTMKEIEKHFHVSQATVAGVVARLKKKNVVETNKDHEDKRVKHVILTEQGCVLAQAVRSRLEEAGDLTMVGLTSEEQIQFQELVEKVKEAIV